MKEPSSYKVSDVRSFLKEISKEIRQMKSNRKEFDCGHVPGLHKTQRVYRIYHIAQCMARGRSYEQIEGVRPEGPGPNELRGKDWTLVREITAKITEQRRIAQEEWEAKHTEKQKEVAVA